MIKDIKMITTHLSNGMKDIEMKTIVNKHKYKVKTFIQIEMYLNLNIYKKRK